jgi:hypothetical protein
MSTEVSIYCIGMLVYSVMRNYTTPTGTKQQQQRNLPRPKDCYLRVLAHDRTPS